MMPTRYTLDVDLKSVVTQDVLDNKTKKGEAQKVCAAPGVGFVSFWS